METPNITVHPLTKYPTAAWKEISKTQKVIKMNVEIPTKPVEPNKVRFVCMSDTHCLEKNITFKIPEGDVFIHAGDFTNTGQKDEVIKFNKWLQSLPHRHKIIIAGNHELNFDKKISEEFKKKTSDSGDNPDDNTKNDIIILNRENMKQHLTNCVYLEDSSINIYGIKLYGSPWQPEYGNWAFNLPRGEECLAVWNKIPADTDILITHGPPLGHGDLARSGVRTGCVELLSTVQQRVKPRYHVFGHIHEGYGVSSDGEIIFVNASTCSINYFPTNLPIVFDVPLSEGYIKEIDRLKKCSIT